ncbi:hypothetical protein SAMN05216431_11422 [Ligilactobacillus sp. WC1T17]|uniref:Uncharacterized protein n=1 Tax=Ligilactobacillus ruminis TaxID=1623 RepID=A0ABY1ADL7_9LACO|nr:hypothetical protein SAMN05216431_11422 [Ligilactobacillus ruminis]
MKAAVFETMKAVPEIKEIPMPTVKEGEQLVKVLAASIDNVTRARANGSHYSAKDATGFVDGFDGVGQTEDGKIILFCGCQR